MTFMLWSNRLQKKSGMQAVPWKSGASAPRKAFRINAGFSPCGRPFSANGAFPQPARLRLVVVLSFALLPRPLLFAASKTSPARSPALNADYASALAIADRFLQAWQTGDAENGTVLLTARAKEKVSADALETFFSDTPTAYEITRGKQLHPGRYEFPVVLLGRSPKNRHTRRFSSLVVLRTGINDWAIDKLP